jgi:hypothetical protein
MTTSNRSKARVKPSWLARGGLGCDLAVGLAGGVVLGLVIEFVPHRDAPYAAFELPTLVSVPPGAPARAQSNTEATEEVSAKSSANDSARPSLQTRRADLARAPWSPRAVECGGAAVAPPNDCAAAAPRPVGSKCKLRS